MLIRKEIQRRFDNSIRDNKNGVRVEPLNDINQAQHS